MAIAYRSHAATSGTDATAEGSLPAGVTQDDYLIAYFMHSTLGADVTTAPTGWTDIGADPPTGDFSLKAYGRVYQSGDSPPTLTWDTVGEWAVDIVAYSGVDTTTPISASATGVSAGTVSSLDLGPVTPAVNDCLLVAFCNADLTGAARTYTATGMTERVDEGTNGHSHTVQDEQLSGGSGTPFTRTLAISGTAQHLAGYIYALAPATGATGAQVDAVTATATAAAGTPTVSGGASVSAVSATATASAGTPAFTGTTSVDAVAATASATAPAPVVSITGGGDAEVVAVAATASMAAHIQNVKGAAKVNGLDPMTATVAAVAPTIEASGPVGVTVEVTPVAEPTGELKIIGATSEFGGWEALQAAIGQPQPRARRQYPTLVVSGMNKSADIEETIADGMLPIISYKPPVLSGETDPDTAGFLAGDYDAYLTATKNYLVSLGVPLIVSFWHEPRNEISAADYEAGWEKFFTEFSGEANISLGPILNGFLLDNVSGTAEFETFIPDANLDRWDFVAVDTYQTGTNETPGSKLPGRAVPLLATLLDNKGYPDMPIGVGEYNGFTADAVAYAGEIFLSTPEVWFACSWSGIANSTGNDQVLDADDPRTAAFKETLADPRAYPGQTARATVSAVAPTVVTETSFTVTVATATATMNSPTITALIPLHFTPPTYERPIRSAVRPLNYYRQTFSQSVVRVNGAFRLVSQPTSDLLEAAGQEGVDYFIGGHLYEVTAETAAELTAAGYTIT